MVQKKFFNQALILATFIALGWFSSGNADESPELRSVKLQSSNEFTFVGEPSTMLTIRPLKSELRSLGNLKNTEAIGVIYLGNILLGENATPLSALREISVQISSGLELDLALITDSTTSKSLEPHELLLLYHPNLVMTLALTKSAENEEYSLIGTYSVPVASITEVEDQIIEDDQ